MPSGADRTGAIPVAGTAERYVARELAKPALPVVDRFEIVDAVPGKALVRLFGRGDLGGLTAALVLAAGDRTHRYTALPGARPARGWHLAFAVPVAVLESATAMTIDLGSAGALPLRPPSSLDERDALLATEARLGLTEDRLAGVEHALADRQDRLARLGRQAARRAEDAAALERRLTELRSRLAQRLEAPPAPTRNGEPRRDDVRVALGARRGVSAAEDLESRLRRLRERLQAAGPR